MNLILIRFKFYSVFRFSLIGIPYDNLQFILLNLSESAVIVLNDFCLFYRYAYITCILFFNQCRVFVFHIQGYLNTIMLNNFRMLCFLMSVFS